MSIEEELERKLICIASEHLNSNELGLLSGKMGIAIFYFLYSRAYNDKVISEKAYMLVDDIFDEINNNNFSHHTFTNGLAGIGWGLNFLVKNNFYDSDIDEVLKDIDEFLYQNMMNELARDNWDFLHGATGIALYFVERYKNNQDCDFYLEKFVEKMYDMRINSREDKLKWESMIYLKGEAKNMGFNISLSHGMSSLVAVYSEILNLGILKSKTTYLLNGAIKYILSQKNITRNLSIFPSSSLETENCLGSDSRLGWCYGDLGIALSLYNASKILGDDKLENFSLEVMLFNAKRKDLESNNINDASLCHGATGVALIFNAMSACTKKEEFIEASEYWYRIALNQGDHVDGVGGYMAWHGEHDGGWIKGTDLLTSGVGVGLSFLSKIHPQIENWEKCLLI